MRNNRSKYSRSQIMSGVISIFMIVSVIRLFQIQVLQHDYYQNIANGEDIKRLTIPASRGQIYVLDGDTASPLVMNQTVYTLFVDPSVVTQANDIINTIKQVVPTKIRDNASDLIQKTTTRYQILAYKLTRQEADTIKAKNYSGVGFQAVSQRVYPEGAMAAQVLGFVDYQGIGQYGVEGALNDRLTGKDGLLQSVTDVRDVPLNIGNQNIKIAKKDGDNIVLTIDRNIQAKAEQALADGLQRTGTQRGSVLIMDPNNGHVLAMANSPSYDPAKFNQVTDASLFNNPIISMQYEPGSVMKTFTIAIAIDDGVITPDTTYNNTDSVVIGDRTIVNAVLGHTGNITIQTAYDYSLNTGMVDIMQLFGGGTINLESRKILYGFLHDTMHLGSTTGIELSGEVPGIVIGPANDGKGDDVRYANMSFGQGLDVTMIQVAAAYSAVMNGGTYYKPTIIDGVLDQNGNIVPAKPVVEATNVIKPSTSATMRNVAVTGRRSSRVVDPSGYLVGGKTGTSQVIKNGVYSNDETIGSYIGFGGADQPKYVIMVVMSGDHQVIGGAQQANPVFTDISDWLLSYLKIQPKG